MAKKITDADISQYPVFDYKTIRENIQSGDLVFCSGYSRFSKLIKWFTGSTFSHVAMVYRIEAIDKVLIFESSRKGGVHLTPLSYYVKKYDGRVMWAKVSARAEPEDLHHAFKYGFELLNKPYDKSELWHIFKRIVFRWGKRVRNAEYVCSELVQSCYRKAGVSFYSRNEIILPDYIWEDDKVHAVGRIL